MGLLCRKQLPPRSMTRQSSDKRYVSTLLDAAASVPDVTNAARRVADTDISATAWAKLANDPAYSPLHRRICVFELFRRHVHPGSTAANIASLLDRPTWLLDEHVRELEDIGGRVPPVTLNADDSVFAIDVLPPTAPVSDLWSIYLRMRGQLDRDAFSGLLRGTAPAGPEAGAVVLEIGFVDGDAANA